MDLLSNTAEQTNMTLKYNKLLIINIVLSLTCATIAAEYSDSSEPAPRIRDGRRYDSQNLLIYSKYEGFKDWNDIYSKGTYKNNDFSQLIEARDNLVIDNLLRNFCVRSIAEFTESEFQDVFVNMNPNEKLWFVTSIIEYRFNRTNLMLMIFDNQFSKHSSENSDIIRSLMEIAENLKYFPEKNENEMLELIKKQFTQNRIKDHFSNFLTEINRMIVGTTEFFTKTGIDLAIITDVKNKIATYCECVATQMHNLLKKAKQLEK